MNDNDKKKFLEDFKKADIQKKLDMWYYALEQEGLWEEIIAEMSMIAQDRFGGKESHSRRHAHRLSAAGHRLVLVAQLLLRRLLKLSQVPSPWRKGLGQNMKL
jgi:hypothetical protein